MSVDLDDEELARSIDAELARRLRARDFPAVRFAIKRFVIRTIRIAIGSLIMAIAFSLVVWAVEVLSQPFASLSPLALIGGLLAGFFGVVLAICALKTAFGEGESREMHDARLKGSLRNEIEKGTRLRAE